MIILCLQLMAAPTWTWSDLQRAEAQGSVGEILEHATDVAPAGRDEAWRALVVASAVAVLDAVVPTDERRLAAVERGLALAERYPFLEKSAEFIAARDRTVVAALARCGDDDDDGSRRCMAGLAPVLARLSGRGALDAAVVLRRWRVPRAVIGLVRQAVAVDPGLCGDALVEASTSAALDSPADGTEAAAARAVAFELCWTALRPALVRGMISGRAYYRQNACGPLRRRGALSELQAELCAEDGM